LAPTRRSLILTKFLATFLVVECCVYYALLAVNCQ
jgi:hypothetical protein